jgi:polyhydroxyalkanoate synthesis regulator phasin
MKNTILAFLAGGLVIGAVVFAASRRNDPVAQPKGPAPAARNPETAAPPSGDAPIPAADDATRLRMEIENLKRQIADLEGAKKITDAKKAEESDPATRPYAGMKLMDDALKTKLALTPEQEQKMRDAILKYLKESQAVWQRSDLTFQQKEAEIERLKLALEPDFQAILSSAQYAEMASVRTEKKAKARESAIVSEAAGYNHYLALDDTQKKQMDAIVRGYYDANPSQKTGYKWMYDKGVRDQISAILKTQDQIDKFTKNMQGLDSARK